MKMRSRCQPLVIGALLCSVLLVRAEIVMRAAGLNQAAQMELPTFTGDTGQGESSWIGSQSNASASVEGGISLSLSRNSIGVAQQATAIISATIARSENTGNVRLSIGGLPSGASATFEQPGTGATGIVSISAGDALSGDYPLTVIATDGNNESSQRLVLTVKVMPAITGPFQWTSTGPILSAIPDPAHPIVSVKDPSVVYFNERWHVFATTANTSGVWGMVYLSFKDWNEAASAKPYFMDTTRDYGNHCAPEVFYFRPQKKWYLISEWGAQYSTTDDITKPETWTPPQDFFASDTPGLKNGLDFWVICDSINCYFFFTDDAGRFYRSQTTVQKFPRGFSNPVLVMQAANAADLFEASNTYKIKGTNQYLTLIEAMAPDSGKRYFRAFLADRLDGSWTPLTGAADWAAPFLGANNVNFATTGRRWTMNFSHGEMIRDGYDETLTIDPNNLKYLYQGLDVQDVPVADYTQQPWRLGIAERKTN